MLRRAFLLSACSWRSLHLAQTDQHRQRLPELPREPLVQRIDAVESERVNALAEGAIGFAGLWWSMTGAGRDCHLFDCSSGHG